MRMRDIITTSYEIVETTEAMVVLESRLSKNLPIDAANLIKRFPGIERDLAFVDDWMDGSEVEYRLIATPMARFDDRARELLATYPQFPVDARRTAKIVRAIRSGAPVWPIFVDTEAMGDEEGFIMEGRHRIVAFHKLGLEIIPVVYVTKLDSDT